MRNTRKIIITLLLIIQSIMLVACSKKELTHEEIKGYNSGLETIVDEATYTAKRANLFTDDEEDFVNSPLNYFKVENTATVLLDDDNTIIYNAVDETDIYMEDGNLIVDSTKKLTLVVTGTLNGSIIIYKTDGKLQLVLDGVTITSESGPAINIQTEKRVFLVINNGTTNTVTDGVLHPAMGNGSSTNGAIFSENQLIISGTGELNINARYRHGIVSDDYVKILSGTINVLSAEFDGIHTNDYIVIDGGTVNINAKSDGMECEKGHIVINGGIVIIRANNDGIKTSYQGVDNSISPIVQVNNGIIEINVHNEGINSTLDAILNGGSMSIQSTGDAISVKGEIQIFDGIYFFHSLENQTLDGDLGVVFLGGYSVLLSDGETATIESDDGEISIDGGTVVMAGPVDFEIAQSNQGYLKCGNVQENEILHIRRNSTALMTTAFLKDYNHVILSTSEMTAGTPLDVYAGGIIDGDNFYGLYVNGIYLDGTLIKTITTE